jgi:hypothetical protein
MGTRDDREVAEHEADVSKREGNRSIFPEWRRTLFLVLSAFSVSFSTSVVVAFSFICQNIAWGSKNCDAIKIPDGSQDEPLFPLQIASYSEQSPAALADASVSRAPGLFPCAEVCSLLAVRVTMFKTTWGADRGFQRSRFRQSY